MKHILLLISVLALAASCSDSNNPEKSAKQFLTAFNERRFNDARAVSTAETGKLIDLMENLTQLAGNADSSVGGKIMIIDHVIDGEVAIVRFREEGDESIQELHMRMTGGKWLAHVTKEDIANKDMPGGTGGEEGLMMEHDHDSLEAVPSDTAAEPVP